MTLCPYHQFHPSLKGYNSIMLNTSLQNAKRHPKNVTLLGLCQGQDLDGEVEKVT